MAKTNYPQAFVGKSGNFYVITNEGLVYSEIMPQYAKRDSIEQYNFRTGWPEYIRADEAMQDFDREVTIDPATLKVIENLA
ncbi:hypothetical protein GO755_27025 [Spirosoma sp. HMF4905]|uniref:Uncharacterized protein n=1 Tax=Spirosoma arboris TaxID=2682092 RepID=A0A7K1SIT7_9BACT|nr:hypothetical protein [Spirosoma arboris]MVM33720.1 hypothetical protein [Spirosoma arboris]